MDLECGWVHCALPHPYSHLGFSLGFSVRAREMAYLLDLPVYQFHLHGIQYLSVEENGVGDERGL